MKKVYGIAIAKPKNIFRRLEFKHSVELIAEREDSLIGFYKYPKMIVVIYENKECCKGAKSLFKYFRYKCEILENMYITDDKYAWFTKFGKKVRRWS